MKKQSFQKGSWLVFILLALTGCGGSDNSTPAATATTTTTVAGTTTTTATGTTTTTAATTTTSTTATTTTTTLPAQSTTGSTAFGVFSTPTARIAILPTSTATATGSANGVQPIGLSSLMASSKAHSKTTASSSGYGLIPVTFTDGNGPDECSVDSSAEMSVCIELATAQIAILDLSTFATSGLSSDVTVSLVTLSDLPTTTESIFSGDTCIDCGVVTIPTTSSATSPQFIIAGYDGYHVYNYPAAGATTATAATVYNVPISENLGIDALQGWIIAPGYWPLSENTNKVTTTGRQLFIINLAQGKSYAWTLPTDSCTETNATQQTLCTSFANEEIDSFSVDPVTEILTLQSESGNELLQLDLSQAVFSGTTFTAPHQFVSGQNPTDNEMSGTVASPLGDDLFFASEYSGDAWIGAASLPIGAGTGGNFPTYTFYPIYVDLTALNTANPGGACASFIGGDDPHREATAISLLGSQFGVYASGDGTCLATVNLALLAAAPHTVTANLVDSTYNLVTNKVVAFIAVPAGSASAVAPPGSVKHIGTQKTELKPLIRSP
jgi:hypothetical protein